MTPQEILQYTPLFDNGITWFPQQYAEAFYYAKGFASLIAVLLLLVHMSRTWSYVVSHGTLGQRMRYYALLAAAVVLTGSSAEQAHQHVLVNYRNLAGFGLALMIIAAMIVSISEDINRSRTVMKD